MKHAGKDENDELNTTCVGVQLVDGIWWWPPPAKVWLLMLAGQHIGATGE